MSDEPAYSAFDRHSVPDPPSAFLGPAGRRGMPAPADSSSTGGGSMAQVAPTWQVDGRRARKGRRTAPRRWAAVLVGDGLAAFTGAALGSALAKPGADHPSASLAIIAAVTLPAAVRIVRRPAQGPGGPADLRIGAGSLLTAGIIGMWAAAFVVSWLDGHVSFAQLLVPWTGALVVLGLGRLVWSLVGMRERERVLVVGTGTVARRFPALARRHPERGLEVIGFVGDTEPGAQAIDGLPVLGGLDDVSRVVALGGVDRVVVAWSREHDAAVLPLLRTCGDGGVSVDVVPRFFELVRPELASYALGSLPIITVSGTCPTLGQRLAKRTLDVTLAGLALALLSPLFLAIALATALEDGRPIFFRQLRIGGGGTRFDVFKFRTMRSEPEPRVLFEQAIEHAVLALKTEQRFRLTRVGELLRVTSLDELPQLVNVVRGEMSLVGPRPLRPFEFEALHPWQQAARIGVRPGMTGLWQVSGRSLVPWDERMELDATYVRHWSLTGDLRILLRTIPTVLTRRGAL